MVANAPAVSSPLAPFEEPWGERHFPQGLGDAAPTPATILDQLRGTIERNPWPAVGICLAAGLLIALLSVPKRAHCDCLDTD